MSEKQAAAPSPQAVLDFWFPDGPDSPQKWWWQSTAKLDRRMAEEFGEAVEAALAGDLDHWRREPESALALVLLLDQFTRNIRRGSRDAFSGDAYAKAVTQEQLGQGGDRQLRPLQAAFLYMPLEHAEDLAAQDRCVACFEALVERAEGELERYLRSNLDYARQHRDIIRRFGRFPHRNRVLGRQATEEERAWLEDGGPTFGQG